MSSRNLQGISVASDFAICNIGTVENASIDRRGVAERLRAMGISESYASQLANAKRKPSQPLALRIYRETKIKLGPIAAATDAEIAMLEGLARRTA